MTDNKEHKERETTQLFESIMAHAVKNNRNKMLDEELADYMIRVIHLTRAFRLSAEVHTSCPREAILILLLTLVEVHYNYTVFDSREDKLNHLLELIINAYGKFGDSSEN